MIKKTILDNGIRIITEHIPGVYSASVTLWINAGPELEVENNNGISHLIEHMLFKGTKTRSPQNIVQEIEYTGGIINAFTQKESTCFYSNVLSEHVPLALQTLLDMVMNSEIRPKDIELEKKVILDEIAMYEDTPDEIVYDVLLKKTLKGHSIGMPISGTKESVANLSKEDISDFMSRYYVPGNIVISIAGNIDENVLIEQIDTTIGNIKPAIFERKLEDCNYVPSLTKMVKDTEQDNICIVLKSLSILDQDRYSLAVIDSCLGGGMGARLFQRVREDKGLAYSIDTFEDAYIPVGLWGVFLATSPKNTIGAINLILEELEKIRDIGLTEDEINKAKMQVKGNILMGLESPKRRASRNARSELCYGRILTIDEVCTEISKVTKESVDRVIKTVFNFDNLSISIVGPEADKYKSFEFINKVVING